MRILLALVATARVAGAEPPSSYQCKPGTAKPGVGCACPAGYQDRRDGSNAAICYGRSPAKPAPAKATTRARTYKPIAPAGADSPSSPLHSLFLAEQEWTRAATLKTDVGWEAAANAFTAAIRTGKLGAALDKEAAYAAILAWKNAIASDPRVKQQVVQQDDSPKPVPPREARMIAALELYVVAIKDPNDDEVPGLKFMKANILRRYNRFDEALPIFLEILKQHPGHEVAEYAANLSLDILNRLGRFPQMLVLVDELLADAGFLANKDDLRDTLIKIKRQGLAKRAMALGAEGTPAKAIECGKTFIEQYNADPLASDNDMALFNAMVCFEKGEAWESSLEVFAVFERYFPKSRDFPKAKAMAAIAKTKLGK